MIYDKNLRDTIHLYYGIFYYICTTPQSFGDKECENSYKKN